jgi:ribonuclease BN (tRNA processing enzyme)
LARIAKDTDLLVFDAVVLDPPGSPPVLYTLHTSPHDIGRLARDVRAKKLLLSHLNPVIDQGQDAVRVSIQQTYKGPIEFARDGLLTGP